MACINVENLSKNYTYYTKDKGLRSSIKNLFFRKEYVKNAVSNISFKIKEGEIVGFLGPNGAGKTTTLKMLSGILYPTSGTAMVMGYTPWKRTNEFRRMLSLVMGQKNQLWWDLPAIETLYLNKCIYGIDDSDYKRTIEELSNYLDVKDLLKVQVRRLSLGERMKMELIAALIHHPRVLFLDEPTIGLDIISQKKIRDFLKFYNQETKATIMLTSHYMKDIEDMCKRTIIINQGEIVYDGELSKIDDTLSKKKIIKLQLSEPINEEFFKKIGTVREYNEMAVTVEVDKKDVNKHSLVMLNNLKVIDFNIEDIPLEESIAVLYQKGGECVEMAK